MSEEAAQEEYDVSELVFKEVHATCKDGNHEWTDGGLDPLSHMSSQVCVNCWIGRSASLEEYT